MSDYRFYIHEPGVRDNQFGIAAYSDLSINLRYLKYEYYTSVPGFLLAHYYKLDTLDLPNLTAIDQNKLQSGSLFCTSTGGLTAINAPNLVVTGGDCSFVNCSSLSAVFLPSLIEVGGDCAIGNNHALKSINLPNLRRTNRNNLTQAALELTDNPVLTSVAYPSLTSVGTQGQIVGSGGSTSLVTLSLSALVNSGDILISSFTALRNLDFTSFVPTPGKTYSFNGTNLSLASKDQFLARCVANAAFTTGIVTLVGDALDTQGNADKATLIGRGVTVTA